MTKYMVTPRKAMPRLTQQIPNKPRFGASYLQILKTVQVLFVGSLT